MIYLSNYKLQVNYIYMCNQFQPIKITNYNYPISDYSHWNLGNTLKTKPFQLHEIPYLFLAVSYILNPVAIGPFRLHLHRSIGFKGDLGCGFNWLFTVYSKIKLNLVPVRAQTATSRQHRSETSSLISKLNFISIRLNRISL